MTNPNPSTALVTGANSGIGLAAATGLARRGWSVAIVVRDREKGDRTRRAICEATGNDRITVFCADLALRSSVRYLLDDLRREHDRLDLLFNLAGASLPKREETPEGHECNWATNILGPFLLTEGLIDRMRSPGRIWNVAGDMHRGIAVQWDDIEMQNDFSFFRMAKQVALARIMLTYEWARRFADRGITVNAFCPGWTRTRLNRHMNPWLRVPFNALGLLLAKSPERAMAPILDLATDVQHQELTGAYFHLGRPKQSDPVTYQAAATARLHQLVRQQVS